VQLRRLGDSDLRVSCVALGCNNFGGSEVVAPNGTRYGYMDFEATRAVVEAALDAGINFFDTADVYGNGGSEQYLGAILRVRRHEAIIATKWGSGLAAQPDIRWGSRSYVRAALTASLRRLQTDYVDLYQMHWPDPRTPIEETLAALDELVREGKIRHAGSSHLTGAQIADADGRARNLQLRHFVSEQHHYSLLARHADADLLPVCAQLGIGLLAYFPLENGLLTGKYRRGSTAGPGARLSGRSIEAGTYDFLEALEQFAQDRSHSLLELAISSLLIHPAVSSVITGATRPDQILANSAAAQWALSSQEAVELQRLLDEFARIDHGHATT
jgi:aryl-alcohol dehydrogenase-like predicted oxidoreductase